MDVSRFGRKRKPSSFLMDYEYGTITSFTNGDQQLEPNNTKENNIKRIRYEELTKNTGRFRFN